MSYSDPRPALAAPASDPLTLTPDPVDEPRVDAYGLRPKGYGTYSGELLRRAYSPVGTYEPPLWARTLTYPDMPVSVEQPSRSTGAPGFPVRIQAPNIFSPGRVQENPLEGTLLDGQLGIAMGAQPGEQRGGFYNGVATTPMTVANFASWGREGLPALLSSLFLEGAYTQQEGSSFGTDTEYHGPSDLGIGESLLRGIIEGNKSVGDALWGVTDGITSFVRQSDANFRATQVAQIFQSGGASRPVTPIEHGFIDNVTTSIFGGSEKFTLREMRDKATRDGVDLVDLVATLWDLPPDVVAQIARDPYMTDEQRDALAVGLPWSQNAGTNMLVEGGFQILLLTGGYVGVSKLAGAVTQIGRGPQIIQQFAQAMRPPAMALRTPVTGIGGQLGRGAGFVTRKALQLNAWNTAAGWTIRGFEWGVKQAGGIMGDQGLVNAMDRLMWEMPWSMNPGLNLIDGFTMHPITHLRELREPGNRRIVIGAEGSYSEAGTFNLSKRTFTRPVTPQGTLDVKAMAAVRVAMQDMEVEIAGVRETLPASHPMARLIEELDVMTLDDMNEKLFRGLGWDRQWLETAFGDGSPYGLTVKDLRNFVIYGYGQVVRDRGFSPQNLPGATLKEQSRAFFRSERSEILTALHSDLTGQTRKLAKSIRGQWWELSTLNDSRMAEIKGRLSDMYDPRVAFENLMHWIGASKRIEDAFRNAADVPDVVPTYARSLQRGYIKGYREHIMATYREGQRITNTDVLRFRSRSGPVEMYDARLKQGHRKWTREQFLKMIDRIEEADDRARSTRSVKRRDPHIPENWQPGMSYAADARILGIEPSDVLAIEQAIEQRPTTIPPGGLLRVVARARNLDPDFLSTNPVRAWDEVIDWYQGELAVMGPIAEARQSLIDMGRSLRARAADSTDPAYSAKAVRAASSIERIAAEIVDRPKPRPMGHHPAPEGVTYADPDGLARWTSAAQRAESVAQAARSHLEDPMRNVKLVESEVGIVYPAMAGTEAIVESLENLVRYIREHPGEVAVANAADEALILDPSAHPLLKARALADADWSRVPRGTPIRDIGDSLALDGEQMARELVGQTIGETDAPLRSALDEVGAAAQGYRAAGESIADEIIATETAFDTIYGRLAPETALLHERMKVGKIDRARRLITRRPDEMTTGIRQQRVTRAGSELAATEARLADIEEQIAVNPLRQGELEWAPAIRLDGREFPLQSTKAGAEKLARDMHAITGLAYRVERIKVGTKAKWQLIEGQSRIAEEAPPPPVETQVSPVSEAAPVPEQPLTGTEGAIEQAYAAGDIETGQALNNAQEAANAAGGPGAATYRGTIDFDDPDVRAALLRVEAEADAGAGVAPEAPPVAAPWDEAIANVEAGRPFTDPGTRQVVDRYDNPTGWLTNLRARRQEAIDRAAQMVTSRAAQEALVPGEAAQLPESVTAYIRNVRNKAKRAYAQEAAEAKLRGEDYPEGPEGLSTMAAQGVRMQLDSLDWGRGTGMGVAEAPAAPRPPTYGAAHVGRDPMKKAGTIETRFRLVEADELTDSWDEGYDTSLQPRKRSDEASEQLRREIAANPDPRELLDANYDISQGIPGASAEGMVEVGNHRVRGLRMAYEDGTADPYRQALATRAEEFGFTGAQVQAMDRPVLIREIPGEYVNPTYGRAWNESTGQVLEQEAAALGTRLELETLRKFEASESTDLDTLIEQAQGSELIRAIINEIPPAARRKYVKSVAKAQLHPQGVQLVKVALVSRVVGDGDVAAAILATTSRERGGAANLSRGVTRRLGLLIELEQKVAAGATPDGLRIGPMLGRIHELLKEADAVEVGASRVTTGVQQTFGGESLEAGLRQQAIAYLSREAATPEEFGVARALLEMESGAESARFLGEYAGRATNVDAMTMPMFGDEALGGPIERWRLFNDAIAAVNKDRANAAGAKAAKAEQGFGLAELTVREIPFIPDPDGTVRSTFEAADGAPAFASEVPTIASSEAAVAARLDAVNRVEVDQVGQLAHLEAGQTGYLRTRSPIEQRAMTDLQTLDELALIGQMEARFNAYRDADPAGRQRLYELSVERLNDPTNTTPGADYLFVQGITGHEARWSHAGEWNAPYIRRPMTEVNPLVSTATLVSRYLRRAEGILGPDDPPIVGTGDAIVTGGSVRHVRPDFVDQAGVDPDVQAHLDRMVRARDSGAQVFVRPEDEVAQRAAQQATGLPRRSHDDLTIVNDFDQAQRLRHLEDVRSRLVAQRDALAARESAAAARAEPRPPPAELDFPPELAELWTRYMADELTAADPTFGARMPSRIGEIYEALRSLDYGVPPRIAMTADEMATLRDGLRRFAAEKLDEWGVPNKTPDRPIGPRPEGVPASPTEHYAMLEDLAGQLQERVFVTDDPIEGYLGVGYEFIPPPTKVSGTRLFYETTLTDELAQLDNAVPGLGEELAQRRMMSWPARLEAVNDTIAAQQIAGSRFIRTLRQAFDIAAGPRPQRTIEAEGFSRFADDLLGVDADQAARITADPVLFEAYEQAQGTLRGLLRYWHEQMKLERFGPTPFSLYRRVGLVNPQKLEAWTKTYLESQGEVGQTILGNLRDRLAGGEKYPTWAAWRKADNRIRGFFADRPGGVADFVERIYEGPVKRGSEAMSGITVVYHAYRFLMDARWLAMELLEMPALVVGREGPGALIDAIKYARGQDPKLLFTQGNPLEKVMERWAWWAAQSDPGGYLRFRENGILAIVKRQGEKGMVKELERMARADPLLAQMIRANGDTPLAYLRRLDRDWRTMATRGRTLDEGSMRELLQPYLDDGIVGKAEFDQMVADGRWVGHPGLEQAIAHADDPITRDLLRRLNVISEQAWSDASHLIFGQADRSNIQRLMNHPLLYWPISYQIKATKWLGGLLLDRAFGVDTGAGGITTLGMIWETHKDAIANDPEYQRWLADNQTALFVAQMLLPITPWDIGTSLSPFTRLFHSMAFGTDVGSDEPYRRNIFTVGTGYSIFELYPRLFAEQAEQPGVVGDIAERLGMAFPRTIPVRPSTSQIASESVAQAERLGQLLAPEEPQPATRYGP